MKGSQTRLRLGELRDWCIWPVDDMGAGSNGLMGDSLTTRVRRSPKEYCN